MRLVIVDFARAGVAKRRGGGVDHTALDTNVSEPIAAPENDALRVHEQAVWR